MRKLAVVLIAAMALGAPAHALANTASGGDSGWPFDEPIIELPPTTGPPIVYWLKTMIDSIIVLPTLPEPRPIPTPRPIPSPQVPSPSTICLSLAYLAADPQPAYVRCTAQTTPVSDPRTGASYTVTASADVCREESSGDECVGATQSAGRTGAEVAPVATIDRADVPLPQACVGTMCTSGTVSDVPRKVTVFQSGTTSEASVYTGSGAVNANAPQTCVSIDNSCSAAGAMGTDKAAVENVAVTKVLTTD